MSIDFDLEAKYILSFGVLSPRKEVELLINAFARSSSAKDKWSMLIAGGEPKYYSGYRNKLESLVHDYGISDSVHFSGYLEWCEAKLVFEKADIYAQTPKKRIAASGPLSTAIGHYLPILASDIPVFREILNDGHSAVLVDPDVDSIARELQNLMVNESLREELRWGTRSVARQNSWSAVAKQTVELYEDLL